jgi:NitT/TauT family transport system substrate-binding protein
MRVQGRTRRGLLRLVGAAALVAAGTAAQAEVTTVRLAKQFGISYLPLTLMETEQLLEKRAKAQGLELKT